MKPPSGLKPKKSLGQHFILNDALLARIADACELAGTDVVVEVGAGFGNLTAHLARRAERVIAVEIDRGLVERAPSEVKESPKVEWICADILKLDWTRLLPGTRKAVVVGNIPYHITSPLIERIIGHRELIDRAILLLQRELAERIASAHGSKRYGSISVLCQSYGEVELLFTVAASAFLPKPEVSSRLVRMKLLERPKFEAPEKESFEKVVRTFFSQRRKTVLNALKRCGMTEKQARAMLDRLDLKPNLRPENLSPEVFGKIALEVEAALKDKGK